VTVVQHLRLSRIRRRIGEPSKITAVAAFLASSEPRDTTGQTIDPESRRMHFNDTV
jgi:NAD(P)-dependent dehydrogenase (short-subunit alcohol dehydrogenase family)